MEKGAKWLLVEGVQGKLVPIPDTPGAYYGQRLKPAQPREDGAPRPPRHTLFEPCRMVVKWHQDAMRAGRVRKRAVKGKIADVQDLKIHGKAMRAPTRGEARKMLEHATGSGLTDAQLDERAASEDAQREAEIAAAQAADAKLAAEQARIDADAKKAEKAKKAGRRG